jgi:hypothetical protein
MEIVGVLKYASRVAKGEDSRAPCLRGHVYGDTKGRFRDGEYITTSTIFEEVGADFKTRFSAYRVESWAPDKDGWIEWMGGDQPVADMAIIEAKLRDGDILAQSVACHWDWSWNVGSADRDIVTYRVVQS